ncbi:MAG: type 4a pilus biogenesis protein PilO, partial [Acinetobacter junii]
MSQEELNELNQDVAVKKKKMTVEQF